LAKIRGNFQKRDRKIMLIFVFRKLTPKPSGLNTGEGHPY
jgi:hypothetical protein